MNRNTIKYIAALAMLIDHIGLLFVPISTPLGTAMRVVGRLTAPIMCMFLAEGFIHTRSKKKYGIRLFIFALISQIPFTYLLYGRFWILDFNMIFTLFASFLILLIMEKVENIPLKVILLIVIYSFVSQYSDWGLVGPIWILSFYLCRDSKRKSLILYSLISLFWVIRCIVVSINGGGEWYSPLWQLGVFGAVPIFLVYNGEGGKSSKFSKWFFYVFYPIHLLILGIIFRMQVFS